MSPEVLRIQVGPHADGWLVRAVPIAGGLSSDVVVAFSPEAIRWGASVTAATLVILAAVMLWPARVAATEV